MKTTELYIPCFLPPTRTVSAPRDRTDRESVLLSDHSQPTWGRPTCPSPVSRNRVLSLVPHVRAANTDPPCDSHRALVACQCTRYARGNRCGNCAGPSVAPSYRSWLSWGTGCPRPTVPNNKRIWMGKHRNGPSNDHAGPLPCACVETARNHRTEPAVHPRG